MTSANQTPGGHKFAPLVASQQGRANQHEPACFAGLSSPWPFPSGSGIPTHRNDNSEAPTWVRRGPCTTRRLKAVKASHVWAAGGARTQARRSTGDVVGGLPPEKSRGLRRGPAQGQRTEVGRIRSCCQGWTGLDDCCEEHGQVAPGGREGSGSTRQRLATRGPSSIQRTTPALG